MCKFIYTYSFSPHVSIGIYTYLQFHTTFTLIYNFTPVDGCGLLVFYEQTLYKAMYGDEIY